MANKLKKSEIYTLAKARADELSVCEKELMQVFTAHAITVPEAIFMFERIKFTAMHGDMARNSEMRAKQKEQQETVESMFR
jgi:hypothetical protein